MFSWVGLAASQTAILPSALQGWFLPVLFTQKESQNLHSDLIKYQKMPRPTILATFQMNPFHTTSRHQPPLEGPLKSGAMMHAIIHLTNNGWYPQRPSFNTTSASPTSKIIPLRGGKNQW